jgi:hypothetical protein
MMSLCYVGILWATFEETEQVQFVTASSRGYKKKSQINFLCSQLVMSLLYTNHTTCFGYSAIFRCIMYIKMLTLLLKHYIHDTPEHGCIAETCSVICAQ